jgi:hypothetical protein
MLQVDHIVIYRIGENHSAMTYMIYESTVLNMVMSHPDDVDTTAWTLERFKTEVKSLFHGWDSRYVTHKVIKSRKKKEKKMSKNSHADVAVAD